MIPTMKKLSKEFVIGISVIVALVILFFGIDYLKGINLFKPGNYYVVTYNNVAGLEVAAPVTLDGFKVGQVREINFDYDNPGNIEVLLALDKSLKVPEDTKAVISSTLLNGSNIVLKLGKSKKNVEIGGKIHGETASDMMSSLSDNLLPSVQNILPKVDSLLLNLNKLVGDPALLKSIQSLEGITNNIDLASQRLNLLMSREVPAILGNASHVAYNLDTITRDLSILSSQLKELPVASTMNNVNDITANLAQFSRQLNNANSSLGKIMNDPELYNRINKVTADVDSLILDLQKNPKRYISIKLL